MLNRAESPLKGEEPGLEELLDEVVGAGKFFCTADFSKFAECDAVTLAIQTSYLDPKDLIPRLLGPDRRAPECRPAYNAGDTRGA